MLDDQTWDQLGTQREDALVWSPSLGDVRTRLVGPEKGVERMERMGISEGSGHNKGPAEKGEGEAGHTPDMTQVASTWGPEDRGWHDRAGYLGWETKDVPNQGLSF